MMAHIHANIPAYLMPNGRRSKYKETDKINTRHRHRCRYQISLLVPAARQLNRLSLLPLLEFSPLLVPCIHLVLHIEVFGEIASTDTGLKPLAGRTVQGLGLLEYSEGKGRVVGGGIAAPRVCQERNVRVMQGNRTDEIPPVVVAKDATESDMMML